MAETRIGGLYYGLALETKDFDADVKRVEGIVADIGNDVITVKADAGPVNRVAKALQEMDNAARGSATAQRTVEQSATQAASALAREQRELRGLATAALKEAEALREAAEAEDELLRKSTLMRIEANRLNDAFDANETAAARAATIRKDEGEAVDGVAASFRGLASAAITYKAVQYAKDALQLADAYRNLQSRLSLVTTGAENLNAVTRQLFNVAQDTRSGLEANVALYTSLARSTKTLGLSQEQLVSITKTVGQSFLISGAGAAETEAAVRQLGQALASGTLRGDEFNSIAENAPRLQQAVADSLGMTVGQLRKYAEEGKITAEVVTTALLKAGQSIDTEAGKIALTVGGALTQAKNALLLAIGQFDKASGASAALAKAISDLAKASSDADPKIGSFATRFGLLSGFIAATTNALAGHAQMLFGLILPGFGLWAKGQDRVARGYAEMAKSANAFYDSTNGIVPQKTPTLASFFDGASFTPFGTKGKGSPVTPPTVTAGSDEYKAAAQAATLLRDRTRELTQALGFGVDTIEEINARYELKSKLMQIDAEASKADAKITKTQAEELKKLARETYEYEKSLRAVKEEKEAQKAVDDAKKKNDDIAKRDAKEIADAQDVLRASLEKGAAAVRKDADAQAYELSIIGKVGTELNALADERLRATKVAEYEAAGLDKLQASRFADAHVAGEQVKRQRELVAVAKQYTKELNGKNPFAIPDTGNVDVLTAGLLSASNAAGALAEKLGESGSEIARLAKAGINLANILKSVNTLQEVNKAGSGASSAQKLGAKTDTIALVVGGVVELAGALDLFGSKAARRAAELKQAAVDFNRALEDFVITDLTDLQQSIRQNLKGAASLAVDAVKAAGGTISGTPNFKSASDVQAFADEMRAQSASLVAVNKGLAQAFASIADELQKVATETAANEVKLKAAHDKQVARNTEDLQVRALLAAGDKEGADALRDRLARERELKTAQEDLTDTGIAYAAVLKEVLANEQALAEAEKQRANAARILGDDIAFLGLKGQEALSTTVASLAGQFADIKTAVDGLDLSTQAGIDALKQRGIDLYQTFKADGVITDAEQAILDALSRILNAATDTFDTLAARVSRSLSQLDDTNTILGGDARTQFSRTVGAARGFSGALDAILGSVDLTRSNGADALRAQLQSLYTNLLQDGLTEEETVIVGLIKTLLSGLDNAVDEASQEAEAKTAAAIAKRNAAKDRANRTNAVNDAEGVGAFVNMLSALAPALANLFGEFDVTKVAGVDAAKARLRELNQAIDSLSDAQITEQFGLTRDELLDAILALDSSFDGLAGSARDAASAAVDLANKQRDFSASVQDEFLRASGRTQEADIAAAKARTAEKLQTAKELGASQAEIDRINETGALQIQNIVKQYAEQAASAVTQSSASSGPDLAQQRTDFVASGVTAITQVQALRLTDLAASQLQVQQSIRGLLESALRMPGAPLVPALPSGGFSASPNAEQFVINISVSGPVLGQSAADAGAQIAEAIAPQLDKLLGRRLIDASRRSGNLR